jgi:uncharacterized protein (TIGR04255 family)
MARARQLRNAPIREAVIDIQVSPPIALELLEGIGEHLVDAHTKDQIWQASVGVDVGKVSHGEVSTQKSPIGYRYAFKNAPLILMVYRRGFALSSLTPYPGWEHLIEKAQQLWEIYLKVAKPESITRVAVRYINNMAVPLPISDFKEFLNVPPEVPEGLPQSLGSFLQRFVIVDQKSSTTAVVTQALESQFGDQNAVNILLDIDAFKIYPSESISSIDLWNILGDLRNFKNEIFFKYLTEKTVELFE